MCSIVSGGGFDECEVLQGLRDELQRLKADDVVRLSYEFYLVALVRISFFYN